MHAKDIGRDHKLHLVLYTYYIAENKNKLVTTARFLMETRAIRNEIRKKMFDGVVSMIVGSFSANR